MRFIAVLRATPLRAGTVLLMVLASACLSQARAEEPLLEYRLKGVKGELADNIRGWLGAAPDTPSERINFISSAEERSLKALQALGYYRATVRQELEQREPRWRLTLIVDAGEPVRIRGLELQLLGEAAAEQKFAELIEASDLVPGEVFHHGEYQRLKDRMLARGLELGYFDQAFPVHEVRVSVEEGAADIRLHYDSGPRYRFGALSYDRELASEALISTLGAPEEGEPYDLAQLQLFQDGLRRTRYFSSVIMRPQPTLAQEREVPVNLSLHPANRHSFSVGLGYRTDIQERVSLTWRTPRINRAGHSQETRLEYSRINPSGRTTYTIPLTHPLNDVLQLSARVEANEFGDLESQQRELGVRRERRQSGWIRSYAARALNESWDVDQYDREADYLLAEFTLSKRSRAGSLVDPSGGFSQFYELEAGHEALGSDVSLLRSYARWGSVNRFAGRHRLVARAELGAVFMSDSSRDLLAPSLGFFAGGSQSLRGFGYHDIGNEVTVRDPEGEPREITVGGNRLATGSLEYQYDFTKQWRGALFTDFGDAFDDEDFQANYALGFGVYYLTQVGPLRLQLAYPLSEDEPSWRFHLDIGADF